MEQNNLTQNWSRKKRFFVKLTVFLISLIIALTITEIFLRLVNYSFPTFYSTDTARGYALTPNVEGWYRREGETYVRINSDGLRDVEHQKVKPESAVRIAVVGDSYAEALQVPLENAFWKLLESKLQSCEALGGRQVEVINFGVSGYGTAQELITLRQKVWDYAPDVVLLAFTTNNDVTDNLRQTKRVNEIPYFVYRGDKLELDDSFLASPTFKWRNSFVGKLGVWLRDNLRVVQLGHQAQSALKSYLAKRNVQMIVPAVSAQNKSDDAPNQSETVIRAEDVGVENMIYREPTDKVYREAWTVTEGLLRLTRDEVSSKNAKFAVVTLSNGIQVYPNQKMREDFMKKVGSTDIFYPDKRIKSFGTRENITVYNLAPELQAYADRNNAVLHGFGENLGNGHWNVEGHRIAAEILAPKLCTEFFR